MSLKQNINFGEGSFVGQISREPVFFELPVQEQAKLIGWANSCPVTDELTSPDNPNAGRGPEAMRQRYAEVNFWFSFIAREAERRNPRLYELLMAPVRRENNESVGKHEPDNVPEWHGRYISPMGALAGYALPRIFVEQLGTHKGIKEREKIEQRMLTGLDVLETAIKQASTPNELLAFVAEGLLDADCTAEEIMRHALSKGWIGEHNAHRMMGDFKLVMHYKAPRLAAIYENMSEEEKAQKNLA